MQNTNFQTLNHTGLPFALAHGALSKRLAASLLRQTYCPDVVSAPAMSQQKPVSFSMFLFGPFAVQGLEGQDLTPKSCKSRAILALLDIRSALGPAAAPLVSAAKHPVSLNLAAVQIDALKPTATKSGSAQTENFLEGIDVRAPEFEEWLTLERQSWHRRIEEAAFAAVPRRMTQTAGHTPAAPPQMNNGHDGMQGWRIALLPPVILGGDPAAVILQSDLQRALLAAFQDTGDLCIFDLAPTPFNDLTGGGFARLPDQINLTVQVRVFADPPNLAAGDFVAICGRWCAGLGR